MKQDDEGGGGDDTGKAAGKLVGGLLKKAVTLGAGAYVSAEDKVARTLHTVTLPKEMLKEAIENFFESYTITVNAEIKLNPKKKEP